MAGRLEEIEISENHPLMVNRFKLEYKLVITYYIAEIADLRDQIRLINAKLIGSSCIKSDGIGAANMPGTQNQRDMKKIKLIERRDYLQHELRIRQEEVDYCNRVLRRMDPIARETLIAVYGKDTYDHKAIQYGFSRKQLQRFVDREIYLALSKIKIKR